MRVSLALVGALLCVPALATGQQREAVVAMDRATVRRSPSTRAAIVARLPRGAAVTVLSRTSTWWRVSNGSVSGYSRGENFRLVRAREGSPTVARDAAEPILRPAPPTGDAAPDVSARTAAAAVAPASRPASPPPAGGRGGVSGQPVTPASRDTPAPSPTVRTAAGARAPAADPGLLFGLLGSVTQVTPTGGGAKATHLAGTALVLLERRPFGVYVAPEFGSGAGYRSLMLGGGLSLRVLTYDRLQVRGLGGYTTYRETLSPAVSGVSSEILSSHGASVGGLVTVRAVGGFRVAYRGAYTRGFGDQAGMEFWRHSVGVVR
ncbi:MAG: SH3 domain-containing protein [Gemmatimonadaceae bacterium]|nr:SH3 domain-containing protein [Gemmatimonadaceae bacterium]